MSDDRAGLLVMDGLRGGNGGTGQAPISEPIPGLATWPTW